MQRPPSITSNETLLNYLKGLENRVNKVENRGTGTIGFIDEATGVETIIGTLPDGTIGVDQFVNDVTPPEQPSAPVVTAGVTFLRVEWDGLDVLGGLPPRDYNKTIVEKSVDGIGGWVAVDELRGKASANVNAPNDAPTYFRLVSVDQKGNRSTPSSVASGTALYETPETTQAIAAAVEAAQNADDLASSKIKVYFQATSPGLTGNVFGDTWFDTDEGNKVYVWTGSAWTSAQDAKIPALEDLASSKIKSYVQATSPALTGNTYGDTWYNTSEGNKIYVWTGAAWTSAQDQKIPAIESLASSKIKVYSQANSPALTGNTFGDTWYDTDDGNKVYIWNGSAWTSAQDAKIPAIETLASSKIKTYVQSSSPALTGNTFGDTWYNTSEGNKIYVWTGSAWTNAQDAKIPAIETLASSKIKVHFQAASPALTGNTFGDTWFDTDDGNKVYVWNGSAWTNAQDAKIPAIESLASSKIRVYYQAASPALTGNTFGDTWFDTDDGNKPYVWTGSAWTNAQDQKIIQVDQVAASKTKTFFQTSAPAVTGRVTGDTWFDTDDGNRIYVWNGSAWTDAQDDAIAAAQQAAVDANNLASSKIKVYYQAASPALTGNTFGDTWFDTDAGNKPYVWNGSSWSSAQDASIAAANTLASSKTKTYYQTDTPGTTGNTIGDTWFDTDAGNKIHVWNGSAWVSAQDAAITEAKDLASSKIKVYSQAASPALTGNTFGDTWYDTDAGNKVYVWNGSAWSSAQDTSIAAAQTTANSKTKTYFQNDSPGTTGNTVGDTWFDTNDGNKIYVWNGSAWTNAQDAAIAAAQGTANSAMTSANGKNKVYFQNDMPTGGTYILGDTWFDTNDGNKVYVHNGTTFVNAQDAAIAAAQGTANTALTNAATADGKAVTATNIANSKNVILSSASAPTSTGRVTGDTWFDTDDGNKPYIWNGSAWVSAQDASIATAQGQANTALTTANGKTKTFITGTQPTATTVGDIWIDTANGNVIKTWEGSSWVTRADAAIATAQSTANTAVTNAATADGKAVTATNIANSKNVILSSTSAPTSTGRVTGDTWFDTDDGNKPYIWNGSAWVSIQDASIATAQGTANSALTTANGKNKVYFQAASPDVTGNTNGDTWFDTDDGNKVYVWNGSAWTSARDSEISAALTSANGKNKTYYQNDQPSGGTYILGDTWFDTNDNYKLYTYTGSAWQLAQDAVGAKNDAIAAAQTEVDKAFAASKTYLNNATSLEDLQIMQGVTPTVVDSSTASGGKALQKTGSNHAWFHDNRAKQVFDPTSLYRISARIRVSASATSGGKGFYLGFVGLAANGTTYVNNSGADSYSSQQWGIQNAQVPATGNWVDYVTYVKGHSASTPSGSGTLSDPRKLHVDTRYVVPGMILDYPNGNGTWELSHWSVDVVDSEAQQAMLEKSQSFYQTSMPSGGTYKTGDLWFDTDDGNKVYVHNGTTFVLSQDLDIQKAISNTHFTDWDINQPNKWAYTKYTKTTTAGTSPTFSDINGLTGVTTLVADATNIVSNQGENYIGHIRTIVNVATAKTLSWVMTHDDGARVYVDGVSVYSSGAYTSGVTVNATVSAGWHIIDILWAEQAGGDGITAVSPLISSQVTNMYAPVSLTDTSATATTALTTANGKNKVIWNTSPASGTTGYSAGDIWFQTASGIIIGQWEFTTSWQTRTIDNAVIANLNAGKITAGTIAADRIGASTIAAHKLTVGDLTNLASDGAFLDTTKSNWVGGGSVIVTSGEPNKLQITTAASGNNDVANRNAFEVKEGEQFYCEAWVYGEPANVGGGGPNIHLAVTRLDGTPTWPQFQSLTRAAVSGQWTKLSGSLTMPTNAKSAKVELAVNYSADAVGNVYYFRDVNVRRKNTGNLIVDGAIQANSAIIATGAIGNAHIGDLAVGTAEIQNAAVTNAKIEDLAVTNAKIANATIDDAKIANLNAGKITAGVLDAARIGADTITGNHIAGGTITAAELAAGSITASAIASQSITATAMAANSITATAIAADTITAGNIAAGAITSTELSAGSVSASAIAANSITATALAANSITATALGAESVSATAIKADSITAGQIASGAITAGELAAGSVTASAIAANSITATALAAQSISATAIAADTITSGNIAAGAITATELAASSVSASALAANSITATALAANSITATALAAQSITATAIAGDTITANQIASGAITAAELSAGSVTASAIAAQSITATALAANSITATAIAAGSITASAIRSADITAAHLAAGSITATALAADSVTASAIAANAVTATELAAGSITATAIAANTITASALAAQSITATALGAQSVSATAIKANSIMASALAAGSITATAIAAGSITASALAAQSITATALGAQSVSATAIAAQSITATALAAQSITATAIAAQSITASAIASQSITATALAANSITATAIGAQQVTAAKMLVADMEELIPNPTFHPSGEPVVQGTVVTASSTPVSAGAPTTYALKLTQRDTIPFASANIPCKPGDQFYVEAQVAAAPTTTRVFNHYIFFSNQPVGGLTAQLSRSQAVTGTWVKHDYAFTVPSGYTYFKPVLQVETVGGDTVDKWEWYVTNWRLRHKNTAELIVDGSIQGNHIKANNITASALAAGSITATAIAANSITATAMAAQSITATAIAAQSISATALAAQSITATAIAANSITASALAAGSITATAIGAGSITATAIGAQSITATALAAQSITATALAAQSIGASAIKAGSITATAMAADSITATAIAANAVTATELAAGSITATAIAAGSITASALAAQSITATAMGAQSITATAIGAQSITATALAAQSITATAIAANTITASALAAGSITATALGAQSVSATAIKANTITAEQLAANSITATAIAAGSITASALASQSITATALGAGSITATAIGAQSITATALAAQSITATAIAANTITASALAAGSITATALAANSITATAISGKTITADKLVLTSTDNLIMEGDFSNGGKSWELTPAYKFIMADRGRGGLPALRVVGSTDRIYCRNLNNKFSVDEKSRFRAAVSVRSTEALTIGKVKMTLRCHLATGGPTDIDITWTNDQALVANTWVSFTGISPALPTGTLALEILLSVDNDTDTQWTEIDYVSLTRAADATLVVDGAINGQTINGVTITGATVKTAGDGQTGVAAQMSQFAVSDFANTDRPGFGFLKQDGTTAKIGMFSEDAIKLSLVGAMTTSGFVESYIDMDRTLTTIHNTKEIELGTDGFMQGSINFQTHEINMNVQEDVGLGGVQTNGYRIDVSRWFTLTLAGSWAAYSGGGGYYGGMRYRREGSSIRIQGMIKSGAVGSTITTIPDATGIYNYLPPRPEYTDIFAVVANGSPRTTAYIIVQNSGIITYDSGPAAPTFVSIDVTIPCLPNP